MSDIYNRNGSYYRYVLVDENGDFLNIRDESLKRLTDESSIEVDIIERSNQAGAEFPGIQRDKSKEIALQYNLDRSDENDWRLYENTLRYWLRKTRILQDVKYQIQTEVLQNEHGITYDDGGFNLGGLNTINFIQLKPYWEDINYTVEGGTGSFSNEILTINNDGFVETPPIITIRALEDVSKFSIRLLENNRGIVIQDLQFGVSGLNTYIIDNYSGTAELNQIDRKNKIRPGTGFFNLLVGTNRLEITANGAIVADVKWKRRYYV
jgi:hypothetical protein